MSFLKKLLPTREETGLGEAAMSEANATVESVLSEEHLEKKRKYTHFTPKQRAKTAKYSLEYGNTAAVRHFSKDFSFLGEYTVSTCYIIFSEITFFVTLPANDLHWPELFMLIHTYRSDLHSS